MCFSQNNQIVVSPLTALTESYKILIIKSINSLISFISSIVDIIVGIISKEFCYLWEITTKI